MQQPPNISRSLIIIWKIKKLGPPFELFRLEQRPNKVSGILLFIAGEAGAQI